ncbi:MAG: hypothetical protein OSJ66_06290 [Clostridia bacterium]|nr:hypothetical protein [Clostridia bacterium]
MIVLSFFVVFLIFFILGIYFSKLKIVVNKMEFEMNGNVKSKEDYEIKIGIYLFGIIKIFGIVLAENSLRFLNIKIPYRKIKRTKIYNEMIKKDAIDFDRKLLKDKIKNLSMKFEKINLNMKFGTDSTLITSFLTFIVSTLISFLIQKSVTKYKPNKHKFIITPMYENRNSIKIFLELIASFKLRNIIKVLYDLNNLSKNEHIKHKIKFKEIKI